MTELQNRTGYNWWKVITITANIEFEIFLRTQYKCRQILNLLTYTLDTRSRNPTFHSLKITNTICKTSFDSTPLSEIISFLYLTSTREDDAMSMREWSREKCTAYVPIALVVNCNLSNMGVRVSWTRSVYITSAVQLKEDNAKHTHTQSAH